MNPAVILTTTPIFDRADCSLPHPLTIVGGLSLFQRTVLTLQRAGVGRFLVLVGNDADGLRSHVQRDPRFTSEMRWLPVHEFPPSDAKTWEAITGILGGPYVLTTTGAVFSTNLIHRMELEAGKGRPVVVSRDRICDTAGPAVMPWHNPQDRPETGGVVTLAEPITTGTRLDLIWVPQNFTATGWAGSRDYPNPMQAAIERGLRDDLVTSLPLADDWHHEVLAHDVRASIADAERTLFRALKGGLEGFVDRYFNRKCSKWITKWILGTSLTPNAVTVVATVIGLFAAAAFATGGYAAGIIGALLFQLSAILDCCDGEVARLKFQESRFGQQLDVVLDNVVHMSVFAGMAWGAYPAWGNWALAFGGMAIFGNATAFGIVQHALELRLHTDPAHVARIDAILNRCASRDFTVLVLLLALFGHVDWFLVLAAFGANIFWMVLAWQLRRPAPAVRRP